MRVTTLEFAVVVICTLFRAVSLGAETLEFPLPNALGDYPRSGVRPSEAYAFYDTLSYYGQKGRVLNICAALVGEAESGLLVDRRSPSRPDTVPWRMMTETSAKRIGDPGRSWNNNWAGWTQIVDEPAYSITIDLYSEGGFTTLESGDQIQVRQSLAPSGHVAIYSEITPDPTGSISEARLLIEVDYLIPADNGTWGRIKALFFE